MEAKKFKQGFFRPINPKKYIGDPTQIFYRSSWELKAMIFFDNNPAILEWRSEEFWIPYISPKDNKMHRYFPDFLIKINTRDGIEIHLIEVKPESQIQPPKKKKRVTKSYLNEIVTFSVNQAKWKSAEEYCKRKKWKFSKLNEYDLGIKKRQ